jgi:hypothetical protein
MKISETNRKALAKELRFVAEKLANGTPLAEQVWYLSATFAMTNRILNLEYDTELLLLDTVFSQLWGNLNSRHMAIKAGDTTIIFPEDLFSRLGVLLHKLADRVDNNKELFDLIPSLVPYGYVSTGNGYYLWKKKVMRLD